MNIDYNKKILLVVALVLYLLYKNDGRLIKGTS